MAWISFFPVEWLDDAPAELSAVPKFHPATWQRVLLAELEGRADLRLHIVALRKTFPRSLEFERHGARFHLIKTRGGLRSPTFFWSDTFLIGRVLRRVRPDVVHAWGTEDGAALVAARLGYPYLVTMQGLLSWYATLAPLNRYQRLAARLEPWSIRGAPVVTTESAFAMDYLRRRHPRLCLEQVEHAPLPLFHRVERRPQTRPLRLVFTAMLTYTKGVDVLLAALDQLRDELDFELALVGGSDQAMLERSRAATSPELWRRVRFRQNLGPEQVADELAQAAMMVFPTRADTSPNSVKEAVVAGVPVIASRIGGIVDYVFPGRNGLLFEPASVRACADAVREAARHPLFSAGLVEPAALAWARDYLSAARMAERFAGLYARLAARPAGGPAR